MRRLQTCRAIDQRATVPKNRKKNTSLHTPKIQNTNLKNYLKKPVQCIKNKITKIKKSKNTYIRKQNIQNNFIMKNTNNFILHYKSYSINTNIYAHNTFHTLGSAGRGGSQFILAM